MKKSRDLNLTKTPLWCGKRPGIAIYFSLISEGQLTGGCPRILCGRARSRTFVVVGPRVDVDLVDFIAGLALLTSRLRLNLIGADRRLEYFPFQFRCREVREPSVQDVRFCVLKPEPSPWVSFPSSPSFPYFGVPVMAVLWG